MSVTWGEPYLSVIVVSRNDNHGGDLSRRTQVFINGLAALCRCYRLPTELVMVEWNPPADRPSLAEELAWPNSDGYCRYRLIEVPPEVHVRFQVSDSLPLFQMIGKNVGIRRAKGKFVLAANIDLLFSDKLMQFLAKRQLQPGYHYRVDRYDVPAKVMEIRSLKEQLDYCHQNVIRVNAQHNTYSLDDWMASRKASYYARRVAECGYAALRTFANARVKTVLNPTNYYRRVMSAVEYLKRHWTSLRLHTNACGDFTLISKDGWDKLRGYPELEMYSWHIDSLLLHIAYFARISQVVLPHPVYHIEHAGGWAPERANLLWQRLSKAGIPRLTNEDLLDADAWMKRNRKPMILNCTNWGVNDLQLPDRELAAGGSIRATPAETA